MATSSVKILDQVLLVQLEPHIWSGRKKLNPDDLRNVQQSDLPPPSLATLGAKKIIDTEKLKVFDALKKRAQRACEASGVRFMGGYAIPLTKVADVAAELDKIETEFEKEKTAFIANYKTYVDNWVTAHPAWAHCIRQAVTKEGYVEDALGFTWQAIQVKEHKGKAAKVLNRGLHKQVNGLSEQLFKEISASAKEMLEKTLVEKDKVTQKALNRVRQLRDKLHDLSFLNANVQPLVKSIDYTLTLMPAAGAIEGVSFSALYQLVSLLSDPDRALAHGESILQGKSVEDAMSECVLSGVPPQVAQPSPQSIFASAEEDDDTPDTSAVPTAPAPVVASTTAEPESKSVATNVATEEEEGPLCLF